MCLNGLQEFQQGLVDESVPEHRDTSSSSHEFPMESRAKVEPGSGKHSVNAHFPKDPNCDICLKTKKKVFLQRTCWYRRARLPKHKWQNHGPVWKTQSFLLNGMNLFGHPLAGPLWGRQFEKVLLEHGWEKVPNWESLFVNREKGLFLSVYVDEMKIAGKKQNLDQMWEKLMKDVDLGRTNIIP